MVQEYGAANRIIIAGHFNLNFLLMALAGLKVIEFAGLAPGPFAGLILADNGASVGKKSVAINPKIEGGKALLLRLISEADVLIDPYRPGVMERLGLGPDVFLGKSGLNKRLIYARMVGFPREGPHKDMAGHDINYLALSGVLSLLPGQDKPQPPINIVADFAGGGLSCAMGILLALIDRGKTGRGQVVDTNMVSGTRYVSSFPLLGLLVPSSSMAMGERGSRLLDGGAPFYNVYTCGDGRWISVGCIEPAFYKLFIEQFVNAVPTDFSISGWRPTADEQYNQDDWPKLKEYLTRGFAFQPRDYWAKLFHGTDACVLPVLSTEEAAQLDASASSFPVPHPRISAGPGRWVVPGEDSLYLEAGQHTVEILAGLGVGEAQMEEMERTGAIRRLPLDDSPFSPMSKQFTLEEVAKHNKPGDLWLAIDAKVYDVSKFMNMHPGGLSVLLDPEVSGQDATEAFFSLHRAEVLERPQYKRLQIGVIAGEESTIVSRVTGELSKVPYAEPTWLVEGYHSPYFTENHRQFQKAVRKFVDEDLYPEAQIKEEDGTRVSQEIVDKMAALNINAMRLGPGKHLHGLTLMNGLLVLTQELTRCGARGYGDGLLSGMVIGLPPVLNFGSEELKARVVPEVFQGKKFISLAISEAHAGSDVMGLQTTAVKSEDGKEWIINGTKKWITNGHFSDYFTVGCKTEDGFTVILVERGPGVETKHIKTSYSPSAGTAYITFDNARAPVGNTLGEEGGGIFVMLSNFNHERWVMCCGSARSQRSVVEECLKWSAQRKAFGKPLNSMAVIRSKMAGMISRAESAQAWLESITYQMCNMSYKQQAGKLAGQIAFLKAYCTSSAQETARDAVQIFGGRGITRTGMGRYIEHYHRTVAFDALLGGAEDVLRDLGVRQALRVMPKDSRL
ncbi:Acyl-CoA dehydrogenase [Mycena indigotica]|uniref:Acyl-CoA dehydrogenase n=1 Tax=Mycena indigotica TaxID=2126181 RepID=A0A8H6WB73_9AGAR|nr:Acyl-CoA dehydrogenase [Mycena indigotica]KAF7312329.1 Acyl-CoA dehydrogenase [Mycena indigotica]